MKTTEGGNEGVRPGEVTLLTASSMSFSVTAFLRSRIANMPASVHTERSSAPVVLGHRRANNSQRIPASTLRVLEWISKILVRPYKDKTRCANTTANNSNIGKNNDGNNSGNNIDNIDRPPV